MIDYGSTELPYEVFGVQMQDGDKRLLRLIIEALGNDHPAHNDLIALIMAARLGRPAPVPDEQAVEWQWVPKEPTEAMCRAAVVFANGNAVYKNVTAEVLKIEESIYSETYSAMLAAAPSRPVAAEKREPLTKRDVERALLAATWPFPLPVKNFDAVHFARAIERAHGIGTQPSTGGEA